MLHVGVRQKPLTGVAFADSDGTHANTMFHVGQLQILGRRICRDLGGTYAILRQSFFR